MSVLTPSAKRVALHSSVIGHDEVESIKSKGMVDLIQLTLLFNSTIKIIFFQEEIILLNYSVERGP